MTITTAPTARVRTLPVTDGVLALHAQLRDASCDQARFVRATRRVLRLVLEAALAELQHVECRVTTPTGFEFVGTRRLQERVVAVSIPRAGDAFEAELRDIEPDARIGKILIQRDVSTTQPHSFYAKLPEGIAGHEVLLMDPMMATAGTATLAIRTLLEAGVSERDVVLANFLTCQDALERLHSAHPGVRVVSGFVDDGLTDEAFMRPGMGDFGDRFYGTRA